MFLILPFLFFTNLLFAQQEDMRKLFLEAADEKGIKRFYDSSRILNQNDFLLNAYKGTATAMYAGVEVSVMGKLNCFNKGKALLEYSVMKDENNPEIRFLRFAVQSEAPFILGYCSNLKEDAELIIKALENENLDYSNDFWGMAISFIYNSNKISSRQKERLNKFKPI